MLIYGWWYYLVGESKKMKISVSVEGEDYLLLERLVKDGTAANLSHAVRICVKCYRARGE